MDLQNFYTRHNSRYEIRFVISLLFIISSSAYFIWRLTVFNQDALVFSFLFFIAELFGLVITFITLFITWKVKVRQPVAATQGLKVDIFIPTYNESVDIIRLTALAAKNIHYPHGTWILDDGNRPEIKDLAGELGCQYLAREDNTHAKAGNLNHALKYSNADFIALFDADHIPEQNFLDQLLGYFNDLKVAYVQTPQDYYNIDSFQFSNDPGKKLLWHDQSFFYQVGQAGRDYWNAASFCGTSAILRRSVLDAIGGFATDTVTEDMHTAVKLQKLGYKSVYHPESLAYGVAASNYVEFLQQRLRWGHGNVQTLREEGLPFCDGLTLAQKICYTGLGIGYFEGVFRLILYLTPAIVLMTGYAPIGDTRLFFHFFIPYFLCTWFCIEECGRGNARFFTSEYMAMARFPVYLLAGLGLFMKRTHWRITAKGGQTDIPVFYILPQSLIFVLNLTAVVVGIISPPQSLVMSMSGGTIIVICFWAIFNMLLSGSVIYSVIKTKVSGKNYQFHLPIAVDINHKGQTLPCQINTLSAETITFIGSTKEIPDNGDDITCNFRLRDNDYSVDATVATCKALKDKLNTEIIATLSWPDVTKRDQLELDLYNCGWHRKLFWNKGFLTTPIEKVTSIFK